jgi:hypothetical protein
MKHLLQAAGCCMLVLLALQCKKSIKTVDGISPEQRKQFISAVEEELRTKGAKVAVYFEPGDIKNTGKGRPSAELRADVFCVADYTLSTSQYDYTFVGDCSGGWTDYESRVYFTLTNNGSYPPPTNPASITIDFTVFASGWTVLSGPNTPTLHYAGAVGNVYTYYFDIDFGALSVDYCDVTDISYNIIVPPTGCPGGSTPVSLNDGANIQLNSFDKCKTVYPVFVNPNISGPGTIGYSGWILACTPCNFYGPAEFDFEYRLVSTSTWTSATRGYFTGPYTISGLSTGFYEVRYRNRKPNPGGCVGPWSAIQTWSIN